MRETGTTYAESIKFYNEQWRELMQPSDDSNNPLQDYPNGSIMTTWNISFNAIEQKDELAEVSEHVQPLKVEVLYRCSSAQRQYHRCIALEDLAPAQGRGRSFGLRRVSMMVELGGREYRGWGRSTLVRSGLGLLLLTTIDP
jgi:hypothetical protein